METKREIEISAGLQVQKPPKLSANGAFYRVYSPEKIKLRPCESAVLNLRVKIKYQTNFKALSDYYLYSLYNH